MKKISILVLLLSGFLNLCFAQQNTSSDKSSLIITFWNVDNLYDIVNDPGNSDDQFLQTAPKQWNDEKYRKKISDVAQTLASINENDLPALIGLAEVENKKVLEDLVSSQKLGKTKYGIVHFDSKDPDGLEEALLYRKDVIEIIDSKPFPIVSAFEIKEAMKDILYVKCKIKDDNIYHIFVNHWPSRTMDDLDELKRISAAISLRKEVDNILNMDNRARIIIFGDFNDEPTNKCIMQMLNATNKRKNLNYRDLYNLMYDANNMSDEGTFYENNKVFMFDQIIVSPELFNKVSGYSISYGDGKIFKGQNGSGNDADQKTKIPEPTYSGNKYIGGASSHFPVYIILKKE